MAPLWLWQREAIDLFVGCVAKNRLTRNSSRKLRVQSGQVGGKRRDVMQVLPP
jgi:hypothetical protein